MLSRVLYSFFIFFLREEHSAMSPLADSPTTLAPSRPKTFTTREIVKGEKEHIIPPSYVDDEIINLSENSLKVLERRYLRRDINGTLLETSAGMFYRVANHIARAEAAHGGDVEATTQTFYDLLSELRFFPNSPTFTGAGTPLGQLAACFVLPIADDMGRDSDGIFSTLRVAALIQQTGGGNGFSFSRLRPKGDVVHTSSGRATGPVGFLRVYDQAFGEIAQGGTRRGANMGVLRVDHPDIEQFITCKAEEGTVTNFNISVAITDEFMRAVKNDADFDLRSPRDGKVWKTVRARELFDKIIHYAHRNGEPGALFIDAANRSNPVPHLYDLEATNPCITGETLIYTADGLQRADVLARSGQRQEVVVDGRFGVETIQPASEVFETGVKDVYRLDTKEGYSLRLTGNHQVMTARGWVAAQHIQPGDRVHILNRSGAFGTAGTRDLGLVLGWLVGDGTVNQIRAVLSFFGEEKTELAPLFAEAVTAVVDTDRRYSAGRTRSYPVGITEILERDEVRVQSDRLRLLAEEYGLDMEKLQVPDVILRGTQEAQQAFIQALFTADGTVNDGGSKGCTVRLTSVSETLLQDVQRVLLNFGIFSRIFQERRPAGMRRLPDGKGGYQEYFCQAYHELAVSKNNLIRFAEQIGFLSQAKQSALLAYLERMQRGPYQESFTARVTRLAYEGQEMVYDLTEPTTHSFIANGFVVHNCGEQWLGPYENCCLGSINLGLHVAEDADGEMIVDWAALERTIRESTHFLDNVVSANAYVPAIPEVAEAAFRARRIGLGIMGLGDLMYKLGIRYGSEEGQEFAGQMMEFVRYHCMDKSIELSKQRGPFLAFRGSIYDPAKAGGMTWQPPSAIAPYSRDWRRPSVSWSSIVEGIQRHGIRNAAQTTVAPTGTIATVSGCEGYGCEPVFALGYIRHFKDGDKDVELAYTSPLFDEALERTNLPAAQKQRIKQHVATYGSCQDVEGLPEELRHAFVVSSDISADEHVRMQAAIQAFVDNSISKTCNFSEGATKEEVAKAYLLAWELGCKGLTVYVTGSRQEVVLETKATKEKKSEGEAAVESSPNGYVNGTNGYHTSETPTLFTKRPRPKLLQGSTYRKDTPLGTAYITVNNDQEGEPFEVFLNIGKAGSDVSAVSEAMGRLISLTLRMPASLPPSERLRWVMDEMAGIGGGRALGFGANRVRSLPDGVAQVIAEHLSGMPAHAEPVSNEQMALPLADRPIGDLCPDCGEAAFLNVEGCKKCYICGYSEC